MGKGHRQGRLAEEIRKIISELLLTEIKDPRLLGMVTVTAVEVTADSSLAKIYLTVYEGGDGSETSEDTKAQVLSALQHSKGFMRSEIGRQITLRHVPDLTFKIDRSFEYGRHIEELLRDVGKSNESK